MRTSKYSEEQTTGFLRQAEADMVNHHKLSERHACALVGLSRDSYRHESQSTALNVELRE